MTGKGDNGKARKQYVTNHLNEYSPLTPPRFTCFYDIITREQFLRGARGAKPLLKNQFPFPLSRGRGYRG